MKSLPLDSHFPFPRDNSLHPPHLYDEIRENMPIFPVRLWNGQRAWLLTRFRDFEAIMRDDRFSGDFSRPDFPAISAARVAIDKRERAFIGMDNPSHDHFRRMLSEEFSGIRIGALTPKIEEIVDNIFDEMEENGPPVDLVSSLSNRMPALVMCEMFGTPYEDHVIIMECAAGRHGMNQSPEEAASSANRLVEYCDSLIADKKKVPGDDLISRVIAKRVEPGELSHADFAEMAAMLLRAGHDTTANMVSLGTLLLLTHPEQLALLKQDPKLVNSVVEEMLRFISPVQFAPRRVALEDVEFGGVKINKGEGVFPLTPAANRDPEVFQDPNRFDITRKTTRHAAFGYGIHVCLGQMLARIELRIVFARLFKRFPNLSLAKKPEDVRLKTDMQIFGAYELPVEW